MDLNTVVLHVKGMLDLVTTSPTWALLLVVVAVLGVFSKLLSPIAGLVAWLAKRRSSAMSVAMQSKTKVASFTDSEIAEAVQNYIEPDAANVDPANEENLREFAFVREPVFSALDRSLDSSDKVHLLVLADSGMGKTTLLLNFYAREQAKPRKHRREIALVPLGRADAADQIKAVSDKRSSILLLDALDEDTHAISDHKRRLQQLMDISADFKAVVVTCRTQFFTSDEALPTETGIARVSPKRAGSSGSHHFKRFYLLPFSTDQVRAYIWRATPWYGFVDRKRARTLVERIPELTVRPMLLALLPDLVGREQAFREVWDLYAFMVNSWLTRESHWIQPEDLLRVSEKVAVEVYLGRQARQSERLELEELSALLRRSASNIETWKLTARSLLNRDAMGNYKFAHRSIMEFLFVRALTGGDNRGTTVQWTDMMCTLFLSWGRSSFSRDGWTQTRARALLEGDGLSKTGIFPIVDTYEPASRIDAQWAKRALGQSIRMREHAGIPAMWRKWTSRLLERNDVVRLYEFSEGIVWQFVLTRASLEGSIYRVHRNSGRGIDGADKIWERPTLVEFRSLVETLMIHEAQMLDERELYWLADEDAHSNSMARLRDSGREPEAPELFRNGAKLITSAQIGQSVTMSLDVYAVPKIQRTAPGQQSLGIPVALQVLSLRRHAQQQWERDIASSNGAVDWGLSVITDNAVGPSGKAG